MRKTHLTVLASVLAVAVLAVGAVGAYAGLATDTTAPATTTDVAASYWNDVTITATATDDEGIAFVYHELDDGVVRLATIPGKPLTTQITIPTAMDAPLAVGTHELKYWAQDVNGNVEAQNVVTFTVAEDAAKPVTTATGATSGAWYKSGVTVHLAAADGAGESGVQELSYALDGAAPISVAATADVAVPATAGAHTIVYHATDMAGNVEVEKTFTVNVDTGKPVTTASAASVVRGRVGTLKYKVNDAGPTKGTAKATIKIKNSRGKVVKTIKLPSVNVNTTLVIRCRCTLPKGKYMYYVYATDAAGNAQAKTGSAKITVK